MGESMSRYSIVERLTKQKLDIMSAKLQLKDSIKASEQNVAMMEENLEEQKKYLDEQNDREKRNLDQQIKTEKQKVENMKDREASQLKVYDEKILAIEDALTKIEDISKTTPVS